MPGNVVFTEGRVENGFVTPTPTASATSIPTSDTAILTPRTSVDLLTTFTRPEEEINFLKYVLQYKTEQVNRNFIFYPYFIISNSVHM